MNQRMHTFQINMILYVLHAEITIQAFIVILACKTRLIITAYTSRRHKN